MTLLLTRTDDMGLDTTHGCFHGPYSMFHELRCAIAEAAGWGDLEEYEGYGGTTPYPDEVLTIFLGHTDFDGEIAAEDAGPLADGLEVLLPHLDDDDGDGWSSRAKTSKFIDGLRRASAAGESIEFF